MARRASCSSGGVVGRRGEGGFAQSSIVPTASPRCPAASYGTGRGCGWSHAPEKARVSIVQAHCRGGSQARAPSPAAFAA